VIPFLPQSTDVKGNETQQTNAVAAVIQPQPLHDTSNNLEQGGDPAGCKKRMADKKLDKKKTDKKRSLKRL
jgi:hypothetical protein